MLGKLMKYEWKNIWKAGTLMLLGMLVVTVIGITHAGRTGNGDCGRQ